MNAQWADRIAAVVDPDQVCRLALDLCDIASPTGEEDALSAFIVMRPTLREPLSIIIEWLPSLRLGL